ncbi:MAG: DUF4236 domain-containing protein [Flavipsychrobacter sp.]
MGWTFRSSKKIGLFRINFSRSGISYSFGVKGARINSGPKGTYVTFGANGIYYKRKSGQNNSQHNSNKNLHAFNEVIYETIPQHSITSAPITQLTDADSKEFIEELSNKSNLISYLNWFGIFPTVMFSLFMIYESINTSHPEIYSVILIVSCLIIPFLWVFLYRQDKKRLSVEINYEIDDKVKAVYEKFIEFFSELNASSRVWQYLHSQRTMDYKYTSGASRLINRISVNNISLNSRPLKFFKSNVQIPNIRLKNSDLYFFPERMIFKRDNQFAAVFYKHLNVKSEVTQFIETDGVATDAKIVDYTWRFLNKNGSPDKRFNNNYQIPICLYSLYTFDSSTGVYEIISTSKIGAFDNFSKMIKAIGELQNKMPSNSIPK